MGARCSNPHHSNKILGIGRTRENAKLSKENRDGRSASPVSKLAEGAVRFNK